MYTEWYGPLLCRTPGNFVHRSLRQTPSRGLYNGRRLGGRSSPGRVPSETVPQDSYSVKTRLHIGCPPSPGTRRPLLTPPLFTPPYLSPRTLGVLSRSGPEIRTDVSRPPSTTRSAPSNDWEPKGRPFDPCLRGGIWVPLIRYLRVPYEDNPTGGFDRYRIRDHGYSRYNSPFSLKRLH